MRPSTARAWDYVELLRPSHWIKNVMILAAPAAGLRLTSVEDCARVAVAFVAFCLAASATYAINDVVDRAADGRHPTKRHRAVARGAIPPGMAIMLAVVLVLVATALTAAILGSSVTIVLLAYLGLTTAYSLALKRRILLDVIIVAMGFVLRAWAGALAVDVPMSEWLIACVFTLCLFMGFGKRRCEVSMINNAEDAQEHRRTLVRYTPDLLNHLITLSAGIAVITFLLYTLDTSGRPAPFNKAHLFYTLPIVFYGVFRFAMLTETGQFSGPTEIVLNDRPTLFAINLWSGSALLIAYQTLLFGPGGLKQLFLESG